MPAGGIIDVVNAIRTACDSAKYGGDHVPEVAEAFRLWAMGSTNLNAFWGLCEHEGVCLTATEQAAVMASYQAMGMSDHG